MKKSSWKVNTFKFNIDVLDFINLKKLKRFHITENCHGFIKVWYKSK